MKKLLIMVLLSLMITGCAANTSSSDTITSTDIPSTPVNLSDLDLENIIFEEGDLGGIYQVWDTRYQPMTFSSLEDETKALAINAIQLFFRTDKDEAAGSVTVGIFNSVYDRNVVYDEMLSHDQYLHEEFITEVDSLGEKGHITHYRGYDLVFVFCNTLVKIALEDITEDEIVDYGKIIKERLTPLVCQP